MKRVPRHSVHAWRVVRHSTHRPVPEHLGQRAIRPQEEAARMARRYLDSDDFASWQASQSACRFSGSYGAPPSESSTRWSTSEADPPQRRHVK
jgi:hypothetical protein